MIDFKVGDVVKRVKDTSEIMELTGTLHHTVATSYGRYITVEGYQHAWLSSQFELDGTNNWSIYNNTKPLNELSDEQRGLLFNHWCNGGEIVSSSCRTWLSINSLCGMTSIYRAKQNTEREVFIDEWSSKIATNEYSGGNVRSLVGQMFDEVNGIK
tara:strand:+ start:1372 stop:1839 length:468 start_codon:yes stop_codon:yes gene_type:complete